MIYNMEDRKITLLKAARDILRKVESSHYVISAMETSVFYDDAECDGYCLLNDIIELLEEENIKG
jgi:hypothetical protein